MAFKIVIGDPKSKKSYQMELEQTSLLMGKKLREKIDGSMLGLAGYELEITGGSDITGTPMRADVAGASSRRLLLTEGIGFHTKRKGERRKKRIHGRTISDNIVQINMKVVKAGAKKLDQLIKPAEKKEGEEKEKPGPKFEEEAPAEEKKEEAKEEKPAEEKEQKEEKEKTPPAAPPKEKEEKTESAEKEEVKEEMPEEKAEETPAEETKKEKPAEEGSESAPS